MKGIVDNSSYFKRVGTKKGVDIRSFVERHEDIDVVFDVGCNNGDLSYPLQELGKKVSGIDLSEDLNIPKDYNFRVANIVTDNVITLNDCTLFLSLYHHLLWAYGLHVADDVFYRLLFRTKYLIFDSGNVSETSRRRYPWYAAQKKMFSSEEELLAHFGLPYEIISSWNIGGGTRRVVVFRNSGLISNLEVVETYHRMKTRITQKYGLRPSSSKSDRLFRDIVFRKLSFNGMTFFSKKRKNLEHEENELENIITVYQHVDSNRLIRFYGYNDLYGLIFEWIDKFKYVGRNPIKAGPITLNDVDAISVNGEIKYIDFER